jgi:GNAT superfamily N-acetyltransferase
MIDVKPILSVDGGDLRRIILGYESDAKYAVARTTTEQGFQFTLTRVAVVPAYRKRFDHLDDETIDRYRVMAGLGFSFGAFDGDTCVAVAIAEPSSWNGSLWIRELHTEPGYRRRGIGRHLVAAVRARARAARLRRVLCETQNTNAPAIDFYLRAGFQLEGFDLSLYRNDDFPDGEIALFMKMSVDAD